MRYSTYGLPALMLTPLTYVHVGKAIKHIISFVCFLFALIFIFVV